MPSAKQPERGIKSPYRARYLVNVDGCTGLDLSHDPSTIPHTALRQAMNVRVHDGIVLSRGGQSLEESGMDGCIQGLIDVDGYGSRGFVAGIYGSGLSTLDFFDESIPIGSNYFSLKPYLDPHPPEGNRNGGAFEDDKPRYCYAWWNGNLVFQFKTGSDYPLYKVIIPEDDVSNLDGYQAEELFPLKVPGEAAPFQVSSLITMPATSGYTETPLFFGTMGGGVCAYLNGQLVRLLADATFSGRVILFQYNNRLYAAGAHKVMFQSDGWAFGGSQAGTTWTNVAMPAGPTDFRPMAGIEYSGMGYLGGYDDATAGTIANSGYILKIDDSSGTPVITVDFNGTVSGNHVTSVDDFCVARSNRLYAGWRDLSPSGSTTFALMGLYTVDTPDLLSLGPAFGESEGMVQRLVGSNEKVYISGWDDSGGSIWVHDGDNTKIVNLDGESPYDMVLF